VKFPLRGQVPLAIGTDHPGLAAETVLSAEQSAALADG
jgi:hypothetical protein